MKETLRLEEGDIVDGIIVVVEDVGVDDADRSVNE